MMDGTRTLDMRHYRYRHSFNSIAIKYFFVLLLVSPARWPCGFVSVPGPEPSWQSTAKRRWTQSAAALPPLEYGSLGRHREMSLLSPCTGRTGGISLPDERTDSMRCGEKGGVLSLPLGRSSKKFPRVQLSANKVAETSEDPLESFDLEGFVDLSEGRKACLKRVDHPGSEIDGNPAKGSRVKVRYTIRLLGGDEISSSGGKGSKPFEFLLGKWPSQATFGWDKAVSTMHKGEVATLICGPRYAFGAAGAPPKIPPNATVETTLELVEWLDLVATYNAVPGKVETVAELRKRWGEELANGTSPMRAEAGIEKQLQGEIKKKESTMPGGVDHRNKQIYDVNSDEARKIMARQKVQGYTPSFGYIEKTNYFELYIPVPKETRAKDVTCAIHPDRLMVTVEGVGIVVEGYFEGRVVLDGCYWLMTDMSLDTPRTAAGAKEDIRRGPKYKGEQCVQVILEKQRPYDNLWQSVFRPKDEDGADVE